jgi:hypothetical protein
VKIIDKIKYRIGVYYLKKERLVHRDHKKTINFNDAKYVGIIYKVIDEDNHNTVMEFIKSLQDKSVDVYALGFVDYKEVPHYCYKKLKHSFVSLKNLNWHYKPLGNEVHDFMDKDFDILIDLSLENFLPVQYILSSSHSKFIVGKYFDHSAHYYDMMLKVENTYSINDFIRVVVEYLKIIKTRKECMPFIKQLELL